MCKFENFIIQIAKANFEVKNRSFLFTLGVSNCEITLSAQDQEKN